jgi:hypothetical protein
MIYYVAFVDEVENLLGVSLGASSKLDVEPAGTVRKSLALSPL